MSNFSKRTKRAWEENQYDEIHQDKYRFPDPPKMTVNDRMHCGIVLSELAEYMGRYQLSFQFWGEGNNNVFIMKDDVDLYSTGGFYTPLQALIEARDFLDRINRVKREYNPNF